MTGLLLLLLGLQAPVATQVTDTLSWDLAVVDQIAGPVSLFLVCLDGQPTTACARVAEASGVTTAPGMRSYTWKLPALTPGAHTAVVQSCTDEAARCSPGAPLAFTFEPVLANPVNLRLTKSGGG